MRVLTINELMRLTRTDPCGLLARITATLPSYRQAAPRRRNGRLAFVGVEKYLLIKY